MYEVLYNNFIIYRIHPLFVDYNIQNIVWMTYGIVEY